MSRRRAHVRHWTANLIVLLGLTACITDPPPEVWTERPVIIPATTSITDPETRAALTSFDTASGVMRFSVVTPLIASLEPGDVIVSEPSAAARAGYLRRVESIEGDDGGMVLGTSQANLTDAVTQGVLSATGDLRAEDVSGTVAYLDGVSAGTVSAVSSGLADAGVGEGYQFQVGFDEVTLELGAGDVQVEVRLNGELYFNAGWSIDLGIEPCLEIPPVCVDRFEAKIGIEERLNVSIAGEASASLQKEIKVASYYFKPLILFIGPLPVIVSPSIEVFVGAEGQVNLTFSYGLTETAKALVGARWTENRGWEDITGFDVALDDEDDFDVSATMNARAYARALTNLKLYDAAGIAIGFKLGAEFDAAIPRDPTLLVRGVGEGYVAFVVGIPIVGTLDEYRKSVFRETVELSRSPNQSPVFSGVRKDTIPVGVGTPVILGPRLGGLQGYFDVSDPEGGQLTIEAVSTMDGTIPLTYTFGSVGVRSVEVTATDAKGAKASIVLTIEVVSSPPIIYTSYSGRPLVNVPYTITASAVDPVGGLMFCSAITWELISGGTLTGGGCEVAITFGVVGEQVVRVTATNEYGSRSTETLSFDVGPEPENKPPVITSFSIVAVEGPKSFPSGPSDIYACPTGFYCEVPPGAALWNGQVREFDEYVLPLILSVSATDDGGAALQVTWTCAASGSFATVTDNGDGTFACSPYFPGHDITVTAAVSDGVGKSEMSRSFLMRRTVN